MFDDRMRNPGAALPGDGSPATPMPARPVGRYVVGLVLIALMAAASTAVTYRALSRQQSDAAVIQLAAEQGRTARRLAAAVASLDGDATPTEVVEIHQLRDRLVEDQRALALGDPTRGVPAPDGTVRQALDAVEASYQTIVDAAGAVVGALDEGRSPAPSDVDRLVGAAGLFDVGMGSVVFQAQVEAERRVARLKQIQYLLFSATLLVLLLEGFFLFRPAAKRLRDLWDERERSRSGQELDPVRLSYLARYDPLTGLINRTLFTDRLQGAVARARRDGGLVAVMFLDIDDFKDVNDRYGHAAGDALLRQIAERLVGSVRESDTVARLAGDEFTVILEGGHRVEDAGRVATKILAALRRPYRVGEAEVQVTTSIGISMFPVDGENAEELVKAADLAMYSAKAAGRNTYQYFTRELRQRTSERLALIDGLRHALDAHENLDLVYLPTVDLSTGRVVSVEALMRWEHPELGPIAPARFVPLAEETDLVLPMGEWVLERACDDMRRWQSLGLSGFRVSTNVSHRQFRHADVFASVDRALGLAGMDPKGLQLELPESALAEDMDRAVRTLERLRERGITALIDDFGTGATSLGKLPTMPIAGVKIDRSFVEALPDPEALATVSAIIAVAGTLEIEVVAEGVETAAQRELLASLGCRRLQGFSVSRPLAAADVPEFIRRYNSTEHGLPVR